MERTHQRLYFLRILRNSHLTQELLVSFYWCFIESILTYCIYLWFISCTATERKEFQRVVPTARNIISCPLPFLADLYYSHCHRKAHNICKDPSHSGHCHFEL